jgi:hypothetical protein
MLNTVPVPPIGEYPLIPRHSPVLRGVASSEAEPKPPLTAWVGREDTLGKSRDFVVEWTREYVSCHGYVVVIIEVSDEPGLLLLLRWVELGARGGVRVS